MSTPSTGSPAAGTAVAKFATMLADPEMRKAFAEGEHTKTLRAAGVELSDFPPRVLDAFKAMSYDELTHFLTVCDELVAAGMFVSLPSGETVCYL